MNTKTQTVDPVDANPHDYLEGIVIRTSGNYVFIPLDSTRAVAGVPYRGRDAEKRCTLDVSGVRTHTTPGKVKLLKKGGR